MDGQVGWYDCFAVALCLLFRFRFAAVARFGYEKYEIMRTNVFDSSFWLLKPSTKLWLMWIAATNQTPSFSGLKFRRAFLFSRYRVQNSLVKHSCKNEKKPGNLNHR